MKCFEKIFENSNFVLKTLVFKWNTFGVSTLAKWLREAHSEVDLHSRELSGGHQEGAPEVKVPRHPMNLPMYSVFVLIGVLH